ncbi:TonB-dependent receptor [Candidatus Albibeggiatoa sp. nov. NOAA]|uniref:TonB-dependent receptor plug domain-containing protein n=1 Tax=Candidatus Albibeggiatoa sp. nov. NOAA TaxID=3162724 RepID=UPI0032F94E07|nr:TonB-dependent receptor [Thiotrichaceae bacterium]
MYTRLLTTLLCVFSLNSLTATELQNGDDVAKMRLLMHLSLEELFDVPIMTVTTASRREEKITETPANIMVVTKQQIEQRRYVNLADLLQDLPSVDIQRFNDSERYHSIHFRGHEKFLILQDGIRIDSPTGDTIPIADNFPLYHAKRVEIVYGPGAALYYGSDGFTGIINIITEDANDIDGFNVSASLGTDGYRYSSFLTGKQITEKLRVTAGGHFQSDGNTSLAAEYPSVYDFGDLTNFAGDVVIPAEQRESYTASQRSYSLFAKMNIQDNFILGFNRSFFRHLTNVAERPNHTIYDGSSFWTTQIDTLYGQFLFDISDKLSSETLLSYSNYELDPESKYRNIFSDYRDAYRYADGSKLSAEQLFVYDYSAKHTIVSGLVFEELQSIPQTPDLPRRFDIDKPLYAQNFYYDGTDLPININDVKYNNYAVYVQAHSGWTDKISTIMGLRYDYNSRYDSTINPRFGLVYKWSDTTNIKFFYGESSRAPYPAESLSHFGSFSGQQNERGEYLSYFYHVPNEGLDTEKARNYEFSIIHKPNNTWESIVNVYRMDVEDFIMSTTDSTPTQFLQGAHLLNTERSGNVGTAHYYGLDWNVTYSTEVMDEYKLDIWGNYSLSNSYISLPNGGNFKAPYLPRHKLKLGATLSYLNKWFITPKLYLVERTKLFRFDEEGTQVDSPGYVVANLHAGYKINEQLSTAVDIYNVFNTHYYHAGGSSLDTSFDAQPQPLRTFVFSVKYLF